MLTLLSECHFWSLREDIRIKKSDYGAFRYTRNREWQNTQHDLIAESKRDYTERRNGLAVLKNSRKSTGRLKDNIKRLEDLMRNHKVAHIHWSDAAQVLLLFSNGIIAHICIDSFTGDILRMVYEKYLVGKLAADIVTDAFFSRSHIVLAYNTNQITVVHLHKPNIRPQGPEKISNMEPKIFHALIPGVAERKLARNLSVNNNADMFLIWTKSSQNEVFPWRPTIRDQDRANIHVFKLKGNQLDFFAYCWSENDPLQVDFVRTTANQILTLEQKISRKGEISAEICTYDIVVGKMQRGPLSSIPMDTQITCFGFSPDQEKLFLGSAGRSICLHDLVLQTTKSIAQIDIIPTQCSWHSDSSLVMIANTRSQFQCFDLALTPIGSQLQSDDVTPASLLDLSYYFIHQPTLLQISFSKKPELGQHPNHKYATTDCFLILLYDNGPLGCLRFFAGAGIRGDIHNSGLTADVILGKYLSLNQLEKAVNLMNALNWETYGAMCLISLHKIANYVFYRADPKKSKTIELMGKALKTFTDALSEETKDEFSDQVFDLKRRFFFYLLRRNFFVEAFEVAQDIEDYDLFMDLYNLTKTDSNLIEFSTAAFSQAAAILHEEDRANGNLSIAGDYRSESACSQSSISDIAPNSKLQQQQLQHQKFLKSYIPPLPSFKSKVFSAETIKINIPKPELRSPDNGKQQTEERQRAPPPPVPDKKQVTLNSTLITTTSGAALASNLVSSTIKGNETQQTNGNSNDSATFKQRSADCTLSINTSSPYLQSPPNNIVIRPNVNNIPNHLPAGYLHIATPVIVADQAALATHRNYQQPQQLPILTIPSYQPRFFQHPLVSGHIPPTPIASLAAHSNSNEEYQKSLLSKKPSASILANGSMNQNGGSNSSVLTQSSSLLNGIKEGNKNVTGEKNKVKFSDTVQVAVVPASVPLQEIPRKEKTLIMKRNAYARPPPTPSRNYTNPKKELADSLPLCHPNDDYLKDFNPLPTAEIARTSAMLRTNINDEQIFCTTKPTNTTISTTTTTTAQLPTVKVVHFGVV
ncbi:WD repeat-containing and planar cell polarity effector protein fritz isoform X1 [Glossina fuscipes]|uniref:WD repeat-containing and planar cell polarity effector protein fritz isoform X1 n=1 Tax=Glossina fuscipes TaxID=7396 RepID=A0A8U0WMP2_9MUSC|nr:WD repeat-containing and planar cell polarity effector protein fritz isoform X1 [Glossina fuscipes]